MLVITDQKESESWICYTSASFFYIYKINLSVMNWIERTPSCQVYRQNQIEESCQYIAW